eukprot:symbB.v1.2.039435.t1/scaffold6562.1/size23088/2
MPCVSFVRCSDGGVEPFFITGGEVIEVGISPKWSPSRSDLSELTVAQLKPLLTVKNIDSLKPKVKNDYIEAIISTWTDTIEEKSISVSGSTGGDKPSGGDGGDGGSRDDDHQEDDLPDNDDPDDDDDDGSDGSDGFSFPKGVINITVKRSDLISKTFVVKSSWKTRALKFMVFGKWGIRPNHHRFTNFRGDNIYDNLTFEQSNIKDNNTLLLQVDGRAGAGKKTVKSHLKSKEERVEKLVERSFKAIDKAIKDGALSDDEDFPPSTPAPPALNLLIDGINQKMVIARNKMNAGENIIRQALELCSDQQLEKLWNIFENQKNHVITEDKVLATSEVISADVVLINQYRSHLKVLKLELVRLFSSAFARAYHKEQSSGTITFSCEKFMADITSVRGFRSGLRRSLDMDAEEHQEERDARCVLM